MDVVQLGTQRGDLWKQAGSFLNCQEKDGEDRGGNLAPGNFYPLL